MMTFQLTINAKCLCFDGAHLCFGGASLRLDGAHLGFGGAPLRLDGEHWCFEGARLQTRRNDWEGTPALAAEETRVIEQEDRSPSAAKAERQIGLFVAPEGAPLQRPLDQNCQYDAEGQIFQPIVRGSMP